MVKLTDKKIRWIIDQVMRYHADTELIGQIQGVSRRRVQQLVKFFKEHGEYPQLNMSRRPATTLTDEQEIIIDEAFEESKLGARLLRHHILRHYGESIPQNKIHHYLLAKKKAVPNPKKQKKRKRCRYERDHSLSLVHTDWTQYKGKNVIAYLDDASRRILSLRTFSNATSKNSIATLQEAETEARRYNGYIVAINSDRGPQFYSSKKKVAFGDNSSSKSV